MVCVWRPCCTPFVCVCVGFCQRLLSLVLSIRICCGSVSVCLKERNWVKGNQSTASSILRCEAERQRESKIQREGGRERADYILVTPCFVPFTFGIIRCIIRPTWLLSNTSIIRLVPHILQTNRTISSPSSPHGVSVV